MADQLKGRTVFITGSGGVLGSTYVRRMLAEGARVVATDLAGHRADALQEAFGSHERFRFYELDVSDEAAVEGIFQRVMGDGWEPNVVLNNAAITGELLMGKGKGFPDFCDTTIEDFEKTLRTNLTGANLSEARFHGAQLMETNLQRADLTSALGLPGTFLQVDLRLLVLKVAPDGAILWTTPLAGSGQDFESAMVVEST